MKRESLDIMLVEDEEPLARAFADALRGRGHRVRTASSAAQALEDPRDPQVLVSDLHLGGLDGIELLVELRRRGARPHAVIVTALATLEDCRRAMRAATSRARPGESSWT